MAIGIICEFNPFHNGHLYFLNEIRKKYPDDILILCLNGYFLERGEISLISKEDKTRIALTYGVDLVIELPALYGVQAADAFSKCAIQLLSACKIHHFIFGSETNDIHYFETLAKKQCESKFQISQAKTSYPARLGMALQVEKILPNDLLAISYIKAITQLNLPITYESILRTSDYHDMTSCDSIISASNIRHKLENKEDITPYLPTCSYKSLQIFDDQTYFSLLKYKIITDQNLEIYLDVTEGIQNKLKKVILEVDDYSQLVQALKSKRYTYNRLHRMLLHIFLGILKEDAKEPLTYVRILGFGNRGKTYLKEQKKSFSLATKVDYSSKIYQYEKKASLCYDVLMHSKTYEFEKRNQPIFIGSKEESQK